MLSTDEALARLMDAVPPALEGEVVKTHNANGRVLAEDIFSRINVPNADNSSMDGYAVRAEDCASGDASLKITQRIQAGTTGKLLRKGEAARIFTGAPVPEGADAIVIQENCESDGKTVTVRHIPKPGEWIRKTGESIKKEDRVLEKGTRLKAQHLGLAGSVGYLDLPVVRRPRVAFFSTGNEIVMPGEFLRPGHVYNSNRYLLRALLENFGCIVTDYGNVPDELFSTRKALLDTVDRHDLILASGGMSVGEEDHVREAVEAHGKITLWQIAVKPGKPMAYGEIIRTKKNKSAYKLTPFIGLPGNPVSSFVTFLIFVRPFLLRMMGVQDVKPLAVRMRADFSMGKAEERNEFLRARINDENGLELFENQGSGVLSSVTWSDGLIDNPPGNLIKKGDMVRFLPLIGLMHL
ncbi:molybdopterin molybdotransferase MoeA [Oxalobacter vibrioformis]|uniref:Molybdopterin molybdenumtransferase n=1 Tax=Oxalobacter vibrioformis TaxID=933080 RepID=A0A9E9P4N7_9BURK|nr:gephyrin-like molybdotransferase Glp [Oxalobacter vibrioformis]WAW10306.1 molybdopterin molybdotransferase MoeA [Oxalobacter vibrioformis]